MSKCLTTFGIHGPGQKGNVSSTLHYKIGCAFPDAFIQYDTTLLYVATLPKNQRAWRGVGKTVRTFS